MSKRKTLFNISRKAAKKAIKGNLRYRGNGLFKVSYSGSKYLVSFGPKAFVRRLKKELLSIDRNIGNNLSFPNGLVSGVDEAAVLDWYKDNARPVNIIIPSYNDLEVLIPCLESLSLTTNPAYTKVIVVDDYCVPAHRKKLEKLANDWITIIFREKNGGFAAAVNTGIEASNKKEDIILVNSDIVAHKGWIEGLQYGAYEFGTDVGIVGPKLLYPDGRIQSAGSHRNTESPRWFDHYYRFQDSNYGPANIPHYVLATTGACMYVKREFLNYVGTLDKNFQFAFEDVDWCLRGWTHGYRTLYFPTATLTHVESASRPKHKNLSEKEKQSIDYFWSKWKSWFDERNVTNSNGQRRIIFVLQTFGLSGGIKNVFEQADRLSKLNFAVEIWGIDKNPSPWEIDPAVKIRNFKNYDRLSASLSQEEAIKVATWWETAFPVWLSSVNKGIPVYFVQEFESWFYPNDVIAQSTVISCYRKEFRNGTISSYNRDELRSIGLDATLLPCGYDYKTYKPIDTIKRNKHQLLGVGRLFFQKNFAMTLDGWRILGEDRPELVLYGAEPELAKLDKKIKYVLKPSNLEVNELYNESTVFIQTSIHEGFCLPILEAMAAGCPVVCTDAHGNRDFCFDGKNCIMVNQDDREGLAEATKRLLNDEQLRANLSSEGLKTAKLYRWDTVMKKISDFYEEVN